MDIAVRDVHDLLGYRAALGANTATVRDALRTVFSGFESSPSNDAEGLPTFDILASGSLYEVRCNAIRVHSGEDIDVALANLEWHVVTNALAFRQDLFHMHGAALCLPLQRAGIVLAGDSGFGKTTLTLALMLRGFVPFGDDVSLMDPEQFYLQPFRRAFHVAPETWRLLEPLTNAAVSADERMPTGYFLPPQWAEHPVPVRWVLFPEHRPGQKPQLSSLSPAAAAAAILANTTSLPRTPRLALSAAARLAESAKCYRFLTGDLLDTVTTLQRTVLGC